MTIRRTPEDFIVEEQCLDETRAALHPECVPGCTHAVYELTKVSLTTPQAVGLLASATRIRPSDVGIAGLKDRHARTVQLVSLPVPKRGVLPTQLGARGWQATLVGFGNRPVDSTWIRGNRFTIVIRDLDRVAASEMDRRRAALRSDRSVIVVNYFGAQRFGSARHGAGFAAKSLLRGEFENALKLLIGTPSRSDSGATRTLTRLCAQHWGDWKRVLARLPRMPESRAIVALAAGASFRDAFSTLPAFTQLMCVEAYQSHLWNSIARRLIRERVAANAILKSADDFGEMLFPHASAIPVDLRSLSVPLPAPGSTIEPAISSAVDATFAEEDISLPALRIPGLRRPFFGNAMRPLFVETTDLDVSPAVADEKVVTRLRRTAKFALPRGAYATVVLRALGQ